MKIDEIEEGKRYAYSSSERAVATGEAVQVLVLSVDALPPAHPRAGTEGRSQRVPYVRNVETGTEQYVAAKHIHEAWSTYAPKIRAIKARSKKADRLERDVSARLARLGIPPSAANMEHVLSTPTSLVIRLPFGADGELIERFLSALED